MVDISRVPLFSAEGLKEYYTAKSDMFFCSADAIRTVDRASFQLFEGETLELVGESGCGGFTLEYQLVGLEHPTGGRAIYSGHDLGHMDQIQTKPFRARLQMIPQDSYSLLNPRRHVFEIPAESMLYHGLAKRGGMCPRVEGLLDMMGLPKNCLGKCPHEFSGGQRQRVGTVGALSPSLRLLAYDEPVSALDVSIQAQILNLPRDLQKELGLTCIFIDHGPGAMNYASGRITAMYLGKVVETASRKELLDYPLHPYSRALLETVPIANPRKQRKRSEEIVGGGTISSVNAPLGCPFYSKYPHCKGKCVSREMELEPTVPGSSHLTAYIRLKELEKKGGEIWRDIH